MRQGTQYKNMKILTSLCLIGNFEHLTAEYRKLQKTKTFKKKGRHKIFFFNFTTSNQLYVIYFVAYFHSLTTPYV